MQESDRIYYIDPAYDMLADRELIKPGAEMFVLESARFGGREGQFAKAMRLANNDPRTWVVDEHGNHQRGAILNPQVTSSDFILNFNEDGTFSVGRVNLRSDEWVTARDVRSSDQRLYDYGPSASQLRVFRRYVRAAEWAHRLMPDAGDTPAVIDAKLELAKKLYEKRKGLFSLANEGVTRGWRDNLTELKETNDYFRLPVYGTRVTATVMVPGEMVREDDRSTAITQIMERVGTNPGVRSWQSMNIELFTDQKSEDYEHRPTQEQIINAARTLTGNYGVIVGDSSFSPIVRTIAA